jgi:TIR domain
VKITDESWGPVYIKSGEFAGRIGYLDDADDGLGFVYFGAPLLFLKSAEIPYKSFDLVNTKVLLNRKNELYTILSPYYRQAGANTRKNHTQLLDLLYEFYYVEQLLLERWEKARWAVKDNDGLSIFISHSSSDKEFVRALAVDLTDMGHKPWLDEWEILPGKSIVHEVGIGIEKCDFVLLILSPSAVASKWVETEWQAKYWDEITTKQIRLIPVLYEQCQIPALIKPKKYVDFTSHYITALDELASALDAYRKQRGASN